MIDRQQLIDSNPIVGSIEGYGINLIKAGAELKGLCPFHNEKTPSFHVNPEKQTFHCFGCGVGGSVIDFVMKKENLSIKQTMEKLGKTQNENQTPKKESKIVAKYEYQDEQGKVLFKVFRFFPKTFRQAHSKDGNVIWSMEGVRRVIYRLPKVLKSENIIICEGEKDVDNVVLLGFEGTCNVGGAGKWMDGYSDFLKGKNVTIIPDNDSSGQKHYQQLRESLLGKVKSLKIVNIPSPYKDVSEWIEKEKVNHKELLEQWIKDANPVGLDIPVYSMAEMQEKYREFVKSSEKNVLTFDWLPSLKKQVSGLVPGDVMAILADTGAGKTALVQNIAFHASPLKVLFFELELADQLIFKRFTQLRYKVNAETVENAFKNETKLGDDDRLSHIYVCPQSKQTIPDIEKYIIQSELKIGQKPQVVIIDYVGLVHGEGKSRYERLSNIAEDIKRLAKSTGTIIIITSQIHRKGDDGESEIYLHDAKDSGSIENSSGLVIGCWRESQQTITLKILKNTNGSSGYKFNCAFNGALMTIKEIEHEKDLIIKA